MESWWCTLSALLAFGLILQLDAVGGVNPGVCPNFVLTPGFVPCPDKCSNDDTCASNEKCCYQGCGRMCVAITSATPGVKPGVCPNFVLTPGYVPCADKCSSDNECGNNEKCCRQGCGLECVAITPVIPSVKPGVCPKYVPSPHLIPCPDKCSNDYDCVNNEKCCYQGCGRMCVACSNTNHTERPGYCPRYIPLPHFVPCPDKCSNDYDCGYNEKCCRQGCGRQCVASSPIDPTEKPGYCPRYIPLPHFAPCPDKCSNDYDCGYNEKCCRQGCGRQCVASSPIDPTEKPGYCPRYIPLPHFVPCPDKCSNDYDCGYNEKCCRQGCGRQCVASSPIDPTERPGYCPRYIPLPHYRPCPDKCSNDYDCGYNEKCCRQGCGRQCVASSPIDPTERPGYCPRYIPLPHFVPCPDKCSNDYDCGYNEKCCRQGCGRQCVASSPIDPRVKPGQCPLHVPVPHVQPCPDKCSNDYDCGYNEKCCYQGCGRTCVAIQQAERPGYCPRYIPLPHYRPCPDKCSNDYDCGYNEKCCRQGCGRQCVASSPIDPTEKPGYCPRYIPLPHYRPCPDKCSNDYDCGYNEKCCRQGCGRQCVASSPIDPTERPGYCPRYIPLLHYRPCPDKCSNDYDCGYNEKCCRQGCGRQCVASSPIDPRVKPGECPLHVPVPHVQACPDKCSNDYDCGYNEKCCYQGCGRTCVAIQQAERPGYCPRYIPLPHYRPCPDKCSNDYDCGYNEKCCRQGCGRQCVASSPIDPTERPGFCPRYIPLPHYRPCPDKCSNDYDCGYNEKCCYQGCGRQCVASSPIDPNERPGYCPRYIPLPHYRPCPDKCSNDYDCGYNEKCCRQGCGRQCVASSPIDPRVKPGDCPLHVPVPHVQPCPDKCSNDYDCGYNEKCCYQGCGRTCVAIQQADRPGYCPRYIPLPHYRPCPDKCSNDYDCGYNEKCCYQGCGRQCVASSPIDPRVKPGQCPNFVLTPHFVPCPDKCSNDYDCGYNEKCCRQGCGHECVAITPANPTEKPGYCPRYIPLPHYRPCPDKCSNDYDCGYNEKCCRQGCGRQCVASSPIDPNVKPGECPLHVPVPHVQPCPDKCSNDYDCAYNEKCCYQGCGRTCVAFQQADKPGYCPRYIPLPHYRPCPDKCSNDYDCGYNEKCCYQGCGRQCVASSPIDPNVKPGECPLHVPVPHVQPCPDKCSNDYDCGYNEKCCYQGCGRTCVAIQQADTPGYCPRYIPLPHYRPCPDKCSNDYDCGYNEKCCRQGCGRQCVASSPIDPNVKPGECPLHVPVPHVQPCPDKCSNDYDCGYNEKCCYQGCGRTCVAIQQADRLGYCPRYIPLPHYRPCPDKCSNDYDCGYNEKCCRQGCGHQCVASSPIDPNVKPGECPLHVPVPHVQPCPDKCSNDYDCGYNEKCCYQGCGRTCVAIQQADRPGYCPRYIPLPHYRPCPDKCSNDYDCGYNEKCCRQGCGHQCVASSPIDPNVKPGECPLHVPVPHVQPCPDKCSNDYDCGYNEKCCYQGCGRTCVAIQQADRPGYCPRYIPLPHYRPCPDKCSNDYDCGYNEKCCRQGCGHQCVASSPIDPNVKPGECPLHVPVPHVQPCPDKCSNDYDCGYNEKCCYQGCGRTCVAIQQADRPGYCPRYIPLPHYRPCPDKCSNDYDCGYNEKCCRQGCGRQCVASSPIDPNVKPGECPLHVPVPHVQPCPDKCSNDYDCGYNEKCCYQGCGRTCVAIQQADRPGYCPRYIPLPHYRPCPDKCSNDYDCGYNEKCCRQGCGRQCVASSPIDPRVKPGQCPNFVLTPHFVPCPDKCSNDYDCGYNEKCCRQGCGHECVAITPVNPTDRPGYCPRYIPLPHYRPCPDKCSNDYDCGYNEKCCRQGCGRTCVASSPIDPNVKPGECPLHVPVPHVQPCPDKCSNDYDCGYNEKCCYQGCGRTCVAIQQSERPGYCPRYIPSPHYRPCLDKCSNDYDCGYNEKCCRQGCGRQCVASSPIDPTERPGYCPRYIPLPHYRPCPDKCSNDYDCGYNEKCCRQGCGRQCVASSPIDSIPAERPRFCPRYIALPHLIPCPDKCSNDYDCGYNEKCCYQGCGRMCVAITPGNPKVHPGECPRYVLVPHIKPCADKCSYDDECAYNEKCCRQGCGGTACVAITTNTQKPGVCPIRHYYLKSHGTNCVNRCSDDYSCPGNKKCCKFGCGQACLTPTPDYQNHWNRG